MFNLFPNFKHQPNEKELQMESCRNCRDAVLALIREARVAGKIGPVEGWKLRRAASDPSKAAEIEQFVLSELDVRGHDVPKLPNGAIDWSKIAEIIALIEGFIQFLVSLFAG